MAGVTASFATAQVEGITRQKILERLMRETGLGIYGTATSGSTTAIVDTAYLLNNAWPDTEFENRWCRISVDAGGANAAPEGEVRASSGFVASTGTITTAAYTTAVAAGDIYQVWNYTHPKFVLDLVDQVLKEDCYLPAWAILSEVPDGDMEQSGTTEWTGANSTLAKSTAEPLGWGGRYLTVAATSAGGYAESVTLAVVPGRTYHCSALARAAGATPASTTATLRAWDKTNSAAIDSKSSTLQVWGRIWFEFTVPSTCNQVTLRLITAENGKTTAWDSVCFYGLDSYDIALPWWVKDEAQVKAFLRPRHEDLATNVWDATPHFALDAGRFDFKNDSFGRGQLRAISNKGALSAPVYIYGTRNETAYSTETETKRIDANWMAAVLGERVFSMLLALPNSGLMNMKWVENQYARYQKEAEIQRKKQAKRMEDAFQSVQNSVLSYRQPTRTLDFGSVR